MILTYNTTAQTVATDGTIAFATNSLLTSCGITHAEGSDTITVSRPGYYMIQFNSDATATTTTPADNITFQLYNGSNAVAGAEASAYSAAAADVLNLGFNTVIKVDKSCEMVNNSAVLTIKGTGADSTVSNANLVITRLGGC